MVTGINDMLGGDTDDFDSQDREGDGVSTGRVLGFNGSLYFTDTFPPTMLMLLGTPPRRCSAALRCTRAQPIPRDTKPFSESLSSNLKSLSVAFPFRTM